MQMTYFWINFVPKFYLHILFGKAKLCTVFLFLFNNLETVTKFLITLWHIQNTGVSQNCSNIAMLHEAQFSNFGYICQGCEDNEPHWTVRC